MYTRNPFHLYPNKRIKTTPVFISLFLLLLSCTIESKGDRFTKEEDFSTEQTLEQNPILLDTHIQSIHILVALCDNKYQGIVPVPEKIGNGQDPKNNLYWGTAYGIKTFFKRSKEWKLMKSIKAEGMILERLVFKHYAKDIYIIADAYDGKYIKETTKDYLESLSGRRKDTIHIAGQILGINGHASLLAYIGHDGLMDFRLFEDYSNRDGISRDAIILACYSKSYFSSHMDQSFTNPLVWTSGLMAPEAYTIHDALTGYVAGESHEEIRNRAAKAYAKYQKCSVKAARNLLVSDW